MRDLAIAYGNNRQAKKWVNKTIKYADLKERLKVTIRTTESAEEYAKMGKAQRDAAKDHGGFVGGVLAGGRRKVDTVESRSMIALDGDRIDTAFLDNYETNAPYTSFLYTTHSHTPDNPRVRLIFPLARDITAEEFVAVSRWHRCLGSTSLTSAPINRISLCIGRPLLRTAYLCLRKLKRTGLIPMTSSRHIRSGLILPGSRRHLARARQIRSRSRRCRTR